MAVRKFTQAEFQKCLSPTLLAHTQKGMSKGDLAGRVFKNIGEMITVKLQRILMVFTTGKWLNNDSIMKLMKENITDLTKVLRDNKGKEVIHKALTPTVKAMRVTCDRLGTSGANKKTLKEVDKALKPLEALVTRQPVKRTAPPAAVPVHLPDAAPVPPAGQRAAPPAAVPVRRSEYVPQPKPPQEPPVEVPKAKEPAAAPVAAQPRVFEFDFTPAAPPLRIQAREPQAFDYDFTTSPHVRESHKKIVEVVKTLREDFKNDKAVVHYIDLLITISAAPVMKDRLRVLKTFLDRQSIPIPEATTAKLNRIEQMIEDYSKLK